MSGRIRTIKPELIEDAVTAGLDDTAFRLFIGVILLADDYGVFRAEDDFLRGQVFWKRKPSGDLPESLRQLAVKLVYFWDVDGQRYGFIRGWFKHQKVSHPGKRRLPEPPPETLTRTSGESPEILVPDPRPSTIDQRGGARELPREGSATAFSTESTLTDTRRQIADGVLMNTGERIDLELEWLKFSAHQRKTGAVAVDWDAGWEKWVIDACGYAKRDRLRGPSRAGPSEPTHTSAAYRPLKVS